MAEPHGHQEQQQNRTASGLDRGWVFCFSVLPKDAGKAATLLHQIYARAHMNIQRLPVEEMTPPFRPEKAKGTAFLVRQTPQTDPDIGMLAGQVEDAFRDAGIRPGTQPENMAAIPGVSYTTYRNETDPDGDILSATDWQEMARARPPHQLYNPFIKPDPWADVLYEYAPSPAQLQPAAKTASTLDLVEDFDTDLGSLLSSVFSGVDDKYLTQPESTKGWVFDKSYGHEPYYAFYACPVTIKPVRQTLRKAGIPFHHTEHGEWHGVIIPRGHFEAAQHILQQPGMIADLQNAYNQAARNMPQQTPLQAPATSFVSDI